MLIVRQRRVLDQRTARHEYDGRQHADRVRPWLLQTLNRCGRRRGTPVINLSRTSLDLLELLLQDIYIILLTTLTLFCGQRSSRKTMPLHDHASLSVYKYVVTVPDIA